MTARVGVIAACLALTGCGGTTKPNPVTATNATDTHAANVQKAAILVKCAGALSQYQALGNDLTPLTHPPADTKAAGKAYADADTLKATVTDLRRIASPDQQTQLDTFSGALGRMQEGFQLYTAGDYAGGTGKLTGVGPEMQGFPTLVTAICKTQAP